MDNQYRSQSADIDRFTQIRSDAALHRNNDITMVNSMNIPEWMLHSTPFRALATA